MAAGQAEIRSVQTTRDGGIVASQDRRFVGSPLCFLAIQLAWWDHRFACQPSTQLELSFVLIFVASELDCKQVTWSVMGVDVHLYRRTSLLSAQYVATQRYKRMRLTTRVYGILIPLMLKTAPHSRVEPRIGGRGQRSNIGTVPKNWDSWQPWLYNSLFHTHLCLVSVLFTGPSLLEMKFSGTFFLCSIHSC